MAFSDPISTTAPNFDTRTNAITTPAASSWWGPAISAPYPTNAWFMDYVIPPNSDLAQSNSDRRLSVNPYSLRVHTAGIDVNKPFMRTYTDGRTIRNEHQINYDATADNYGWKGDQYPQIWRYLDLTLRSTETTATRYLKSFDQLTATFRWNVDTTHYMEAPIVRGAPYATVRYTAMTPVVQTANTDYHAIVSVNGSSPSGTFTGTKFKLVVNRPYLGSGATETWIVYAQSSITFTATNLNLIATGQYTGYIRIAVIADGSGTETMLDTYKDAVPIGGTTSVSVSGNIQTTTFTYSKIGSGSTLATYTMPHHEALLSSPTYAPNHSFSTIRGTMHAVIGNTWTLTDTLSTITWNSPNAIDTGKLSGITGALASEKTFTAANLDATEAYTFGKQISRAARLALIADQVGDTTARDSTIATMKTYLNPWLNNSANASTTLSLAYDTTWGGIVSTNALVTSPPNNPNQATEFGNAIYNDHYFHWGYYIYAAAVIAHFDASWATTYKNKVNDIIRDIANPSVSGDPYFTQLRHYDWYEGHSWASGLQSNGDGRNQESTSESLHAWYGINLWGLATNQPDLRNVGRFLQAAETRAAKTYWQMPSYNSVYPSSFAAQKMVALVFTNKAFNGTWFGLGDDQIVGIETMPFTPATHELLSSAYVAEMYPVRLQPKETTATATTPGGWLGNTLATKAIINPNAAYTAISNTPTGDPEYIDKQGASKTNFLWWAAVQNTSTPAPTATTATLAVSPTSTAASGANVTLTATISPAVAGTVYFYDTGIQVGSTVVSGSTAALSLTTLQSGSRSLTATFTLTDTASYSGSSSNAVAYTITGGSSATATTTTLSASPASKAVAGANVTFTATLNPTAAAGTVTFKDGASTLATTNIASGVATYATTALSTATHTISAVFNPTTPASYATSTSSTLTYTVTASGGGSAGATNANAVPYTAFVSGNPNTAVRIGISDANYTIAAGDSIVAYSTLTATRTITLPAAASNVGRVLVIKDESGNCSNANQIVISGPIDNATNIALASAFTSIRIYSGGNGWYKISS